MAAIDLDMAYIVSSELQSYESSFGFDYYYIIDTDYNAIAHSKTPYMMKEATITQIEFGGK